MVRCFFCNTAQLESFLYYLQNMYRCIFDKLVGASGVHILMHLIMKNFDPDKDLNKDKSDITHMLWLP